MYKQWKASRNKQFFNQVARQFQSWGMQVIAADCLELVISK
jgi:hypothetical protein